METRPAPIDFVGRPALSAQRGGQFGAGATAASLLQIHGAFTATLALKSMNAAVVVAVVVSILNACPPLAQRTSAESGNGERNELAEIGRHNMSAR